MSRPNGLAPAEPDREAAESGGRTARGESLNAEPSPLVAFVYDVRATAPTEIVTYLHCGRCVKQVAARAEAGEPASPRDWARLEVGQTPGGLQVRCVRHDLNVALVAAWPGEAVLGVLRRVLRIVDREGIGSDEDESGPLVAEIRAIVREAEGGVGGATAPRGRGSTPRKPARELGVPRRGQSQAAHRVRATDESQAERRG